MIMRMTIRENPLYQKRGSSTTPETHSDLRFSLLVQEPEKGFRVTLRTSLQGQVFSGNRVVVRHAALTPSGYPPLPFQGRG
jgi:hypothetical protein